MNLLTVQFLCAMSFVLGAGFYAIMSMVICELKKKATAQIERVKTKFKRIK